MTRHMRWGVAPAVAAFAGVAGLLASPASGQHQAARRASVSPAVDSVRWARVTYLAGHSIYIDAGRDDGVEVGASLDVVRRGTVVATLRAIVISTHRASCEIVGGDSLSIAVGDSVRFVAPGAPGRVPLGTPDSARLPPFATDSVSLPDSGGARSASTRPVNSLRTAGIRGRVGVRYLVVSEAGAGARFSQPSADVRVDGARIAGSPLGITVDARGRRTMVTRADTAGAQVDSRTYVYQMAVSVATPGGGRVAVGRQFSEAFANVSLYDGVSVQLNRQRWGTGLFAGTQPAPTTMGYARDVREFGTYVQAHNEAAGRRWALTLGGIGSYHANDPNREFAFGQLSVSSSRVSLLATQEVDYNRGWKVAAGEQTVQPTSTFLSAHVRASNSFTFYAGFDSRRNVRLWRDLENPETEFDDRFRQGLWGGASLRAGQHVRLSADVRSSDGGGTIGGRATAAGGVLAVDGIGWSLLGVRARSTRYTSPWLEGWLHSGSLSVSPLNGQLRLEIEGGLRAEANRPGVSVTGLSGDNRVQWLTLDSEVALGRSWYVVLTGTRETGGWAPITQTYASLSWRF